MAQICEICEKAPRVGRNVSHSNRKTSRSWHPNVQRVRALVGKSVRRINVCTRCLRSGRVTKVA
jgi:large subunit ribosomal protein L28